MTAPQIVCDVARFWVQVDRRGDGECWTWTGELNNQGYGRFAIWTERGSRRVRVLAHRLALMMSGAPLPENSVVRHACDNPPCVNPAHLEVGTQRDNIHDTLSRGRANLSGLFDEIAKACQICGATFVASPAYRYCEEHRDRNARARAERRARRAQEAAS